MAFCLVLSFVISCLAFSIIFTIRKPFNATIRQPLESLKLLNLVTSYNLRNYKINLGTWPKQASPGSDFF